MKNHNSGTTLLPFLVFIKLIFVLFALCPEVVSSQEAGNNWSFPGKSIRPGAQSSARSDEVSGDLTTLQSVRRYVTAHVTYPESSRMAGHAGLVELYARVGHQGVINEIHLHRPDRNYMEIDEIIISAEQPAGVEIIELSRHEELVCEARRVIRLLPVLDIPEVFGGILKFSFEFILQSDD